jgi:N-methylhydantoinase A
VIALKVNTVPQAIEEGILEAIAKCGIEPGSIDFLVHGSTVVINALTERKGAKVGLITTSGFRDVLEIGRGNTPDLYNIYYRKPAPIVPRYLRREVAERVDYRGAILKPLDDAHLDSIIDDFKKEGVEAIAICFLHAYANPANERQAVEAVTARWPEIAVIASHQITREWREFERTNTVAMSAYVLPKVKSYVDTFRSELAKMGVDQPPYIMQSNGGIATASSAIANPISLVESGPVGGMLGAAAYAAAIGESKLIVLDIGGTTAKCSLIVNGKPRINTDYWLEQTPKSAGYPLKTPVIDIVEIGTGGGSIASIDSGGSIRVGPQSAGADPGPVAYGRGNRRPTTTDANLITGRINPTSFCRGEIEPDLDLVMSAFAELGAPIGQDGRQTALGVLRIANANMVNALKLVSVNRGYNPRDFSLVAIGGGGPLHAALLAQELGIPKVIVPPFAAVFSAWGMLMNDLRRDVIRTCVGAFNPESLHIVAGELEALAAEGHDAFRDEGVAPDATRWEGYFDMRYEGQEHTVKVRAVDDAGLVRAYGDILEEFHTAHEDEYSFRLDHPVEVVNLHCVTLGLVEKSAMQRVGERPEGDTLASKGTRMVDLGAGPLPAQLYDRSTLRRGDIIRGPAVIEEAATSTLVPQGYTAEVDIFGGIHISGEKK